MNETPKIRLQKIIADRGIASRREAERLIVSGSVTVNGNVVTEMGTKADPEKDTIEVDQNALQKKEAEKTTIALWKPIDYVTSTKRTPTEDKIVFDLLPKKLPRLFPAGRLDKDSTGMLILTNDGELAFSLTHPSFTHTKTYHVLLQKPISDEDIQKIQRGKVRIMRKNVRPAPIRKLGGSRIEIILTEGKNRHIRRLFRALGNGVKNCDV
jgi:pseudouridine synthase